MSNNTGKVPPPSVLRARLLGERSPGKTILQLQPGALDVIDAEFDAVDNCTLDPLPPLERRVRDLEEVVAKLVQERDARVPPQHVAEAKTVSVQLVGYTLVEDGIRFRNFVAERPREVVRHRASPRQVLQRERCSKGWTFQLRPGETQTVHELFCETVAPGAWLIVQGPGLLYDVTVGHQRCELPSHASGREHKGPRCVLPRGIQIQERLAFNLELAP